MLPHQGYSRPENPKRHGFDSSIKLSPLQNYGIMFPSEKESTLNQAIGFMHEIEVYSVLFPR